MSTIRPLQNCPVGMFDVPLFQLNSLITCAHAQELVLATCSHCPTIVTCARIVAPFVACDPCITRINRERELDAARDYWLRVCPASFRATDTQHPMFPRSIHTRVQALDLNKSLFLYGPTGTCKTRIAMLRLKAAVLKGKDVKIIWPEQLESYKGYTAETKFEAIASFDMVLLDDPLITACRETRLADTLKHLVDILMRHDRTLIVTSQIGEEDFLSGNTYGELKPADRERGAAIMRRLKEKCEVIAFK